ncbi:membrane protein [Pseudoclavibacter endophyticus]|uniref:DUF4129 domain-containing protein n=1 Tax=Pseudoclavibacter endophyticus TaxID=1778590 RepID=A0A6H9WS49_9MICO|nr:DUF4129 domain-containing protein [Pseudoclavibacter endophyticus]KAB1649144.1 DUF4129 domain-containing protein [Pseudoclavibacter endophyticus]GGA65061.1 membrane protein [Pseudoclavibacter endophyticus]
MNPLVLAAQVPLDPEADEASEWLRQELAKQEYLSAQPSLWDRAIAAFWEWVNSLFGNVPGAPIDPTGILVALVVVVLGIVLAILVGRPVLARRSAATSDRHVFLDDDARSAAELRAASEAAAERGDWALAVTERYRALARELGDRTLIAVRPGSTAHDVARRAAVPFPDEADALASAARDFDDVRYLDRAGTEAAWHRTRELDTRLATARPAAIGDLDRMHA